MLPKIKAGGGFFSYFKTEKGRKLVFYAAGATTVGLFLGNFLPHTFGLKYYRDFVQCYQWVRKLLVTGSDSNIPLLFIDTAWGVQCRRQCSSAWKRHWIIWA